LSKLPGREYAGPRSDAPTALLLSHVGENTKLWAGIKALAAAFGHKGLLWGLDIVYVMKSGFNFPP